VSNKPSSVRQRVSAGRGEADARRLKTPGRAVVRRTSEPLLNPRRMRISVRVLAGLLVVVAVILLFASPMFAVRRVVVGGLASLTPEEAIDVQTQAHVPPRTNLFLAGTGKLAEGLRRLPCVAQATVSRQLPGTLTVKITPRTAAAVLHLGEDRWELDDRGTVIRAARASQGLPRIAYAGSIEVRPGTTLADTAVGGALSVLRLANGRQPLRIAKIEVDQSADIWLNMRDTVAIRLGHAEDLARKVALIRSIYADKPDIAAEVQSIDLTCPDAPACTPRDATKGSP
jgi:cell division protein FtsQ